MSTLGHGLCGIRVGFGAMFWGHGIRAGDVVSRSRIASFRESLALG